MSLHRTLILTTFLLFGPALFAANPSAVSESETTLRRNLAWQVGLEKLGFSPGLIDGHVGTKTTLATQEFQRVRSLPITGKLDPATATALEIDPDHVIGRYTIVQEDLDEVGPLPKSWVERSRLKYLGHEALENVIAEKFHCSIGLLAALNHGKDINALQPGNTVIVPIIQEPDSYPKAARIEVNLAEKVIRLVGKDNQLLAMFHCSIAKDKEKRPTGEARVVAVAMDPNYTFRPEMWPEVTEKIPGPLNIPPGPRNPVGRCWVALSLPGYGMHGTPNPELIGKTGSHGCFRLANWDAVRLGKMVESGMPVRFTDQPTSLARR